ncbi:MAG: HigA family addiction module antitoxin [Candidatus Latescibacterota bacterium]
MFLRSARLGEDSSPAATCARRWRLSSATTPRCWTRWSRSSATCTRRTSRSLARCRDELEERGWTQKDLAEILGRPLQSVNQIINGRKRITPETAVELAAAFGTSRELWLHLEASFRLSQLGRPDPAIARRARARLAVAR